MKALIRTRVLILSSVLVPLAAVAAAGAARADVSQTPIATSCPAAYELKAVSWFEAQAPYKLPRLVDTAGNNNGYVCSLALPDPRRDADCMTGGTIACILEQLGLPIYQFVDDGNPANQQAQVGG